MVPTGDHDCPWKDRTERLESEVTDLKAKLDALQRKVFGKTSEKMPPMDREVRRGAKVDPEKRLQTRRTNAELRAKKLETEIVQTSVPKSDQHCSRCSGSDFTPLGADKPSSIIEYVPGYFRRRIFHREKLVCACGSQIITAPVPDKVFDRTQYGPGFIAHLVVCKCCDSLPFYRIEKQFRRIGVPMARSTMTSLFHRAGELLTPIADRILALIASSEVVLADETPERMQRGGKKGYIWTFVAGRFVGYRFSADRSGDTPKHVLGGTSGTLVVDMYTGYNQVTGTGGRERAGCLAHARRKFFEALKTAPEAQFALDTIRDIYVAEHQIREAGLHGTEQHAIARWQSCLPAMDKLYLWLAEQKKLHPPKSQMGIAINYSLKNWQALTRYIRDVRVPPDNNRSENALRVVALGRKNFLFVGHQKAGNNLAALYTVVGTCLAHDLDPLAYLSDVLMRLDSTSANGIDALLPHNWTQKS